MHLNEFCAPALLYLAFSITHIIIDVFKHLYNTALVKFIVMIMFTLLLNILCQRGLNVISWFIVFIPFITMTIITSLLLIIFGLSPFSGRIYKDTSEHNKNKENKSNKNKSNKNKSNKNKSNKNDHHDNFYN